MCTYIYTIVSFTHEDLYILEAEVSGPAVAPFVLVFPFPVSAFFASVVCWK